jgi:uncharacterized protein YyaL (SSP411 family)
MTPILLALLLASSSPASGGDDARARYQRFSEQVLASYDSTRGGFVTKSGVPVESAVELALLRASDPADGGEWAARADYTMRWTRGLLDTLLGGYYHGGKGTDLGIDKRADSNARRLELLLAASRTTGGEAYRKDAERLVSWFERVLVDGRGGFVAAQVGDRELEPRANGLAIHAWLSWSAETRDPARRDFALRSLDRVWEACWTPGLGLLRKNSFGDVIREPLLVDQVEMGRALVLASRLCERPQDRERARVLGELVVKRFEERALGGFRTQSVPERNGSIQRAKRVPAENARAALFLCELSALTGVPAYRQSATRAAGAFKKDLEKVGLGAADWALAMRASFDPDMPNPPEWRVAERQEPVRKPAVRIKLGRY